MKPKHYGNAKRKILIIEDNELNREILASILEDEFDILCAEDGEQGLQTLKDHSSEISLVILDVYMPVCDGFEFLRRIAKDQILSSIPVLVATGSENPEDEVKCLRLGASDFVTKPYNPDVVVGRVHSMIRLRESVATLSVVEHDVLTGLYNMQAFFHHAQELLSSNLNESFDLAVCDIQDLGLINSVFGTRKGDEILKQIAQPFVELPSKVLVGRSNDKFFCLYASSDSPDEERATNWISGLLDNVHVGNLHIRFGVYPNVDRSVPVSILCDRVVLAASTIKQSLKGEISLYDENIHQKLSEQQNMEMSFDKAIETEEFCVWYQPKIDCHTEKIAGAEALVRWIRGDGAFISPGAFIPLFEKDGLISRLDEYVFTRVCRFQSSRVSEGKPVVPISINLSRNSIYQKDVVQRYSEIVSAYNLDKALVPIELTESAAAESEEVSNVLESFSQAGFQIHIDDFGKGYSSLSSLVTLPFDVVKIDKSIIDRIGDPKGDLLVAHIVKLARDLGLETVAEGVEERSQVDFLKDASCDRIQGFYFSAPKKQELFEKMLDESTGKTL